MKLFRKLTLFMTLSKLAIVLLFVLILPSLVEKIALQYTDYNLRQQEKQVLDIVRKNGINSYFQGEDYYSGYTMLKEEYISLEKANAKLVLDTIITSQREVELVETDTLTYRILSRTFNAGKSKYLLEIGKTTSAISLYNKPLQKIALYILISLVVLTILIDLLFTRFLLGPLDKIIKSKLINQKFPFNENAPPVKTNTTDFRYLDNSLIKLMEQINDAFEKEREFTANASHELMTPISILQSKIENLMLHDEVNEDVHGRLQEMMKTLTRLKKIVKSLLLISRIDNEQFSRFDEVNVKELFDELTEEIEHRLEQKSISLHVQLSPSVKLKHVNRDLLFQMICNLVINAVKYNKPGGSISIEDEFDAGKYTVKIKDTGIGIPEQELDSVFERFKKTNLSKGAGYGLGLAIVKSIAGYHKVELKVASKVNTGTTVSVIIPEGSFE